MPTFHGVEVEKGEPVVWEEPELLPTANAILRTAEWLKATVGRASGGLVIRNQIYCERWNQRLHAILPATFTLPVGTNLAEASGMYRSRVLSDVTVEAVPDGMWVGASVRSESRYRSRTETDHITVYEFPGQTDWAASISIVNEYRSPSGQRASVHYMLQDDSYNPGSLPGFGRGIHFPGWAEQGASGLLDDTTGADVVAAEAFMDLAQEIARRQNVVIPRAK